MIDNKPLSEIQFKDIRDFNTELYIKYGDIIESLGPVNILFDKI